MRRRSFSQLQTFSQGDFNMKDGTAVTGVECPRCKNRSVQTIPSQGGGVQYYICPYDKYIWQGVGLRMKA